MSARLGCHDHKSLHGCLHTDALQTAGPAVSQGLCMGKASAQLGTYTGPSKVAFAALALNSAACTALAVTLQAAVQVS